MAELSDYPLPPSRSGFALLIVLWVIAILALIDTAIIARSRTSTRLEENLQAIAYAESAADGGVAEAIFRLQNKQWTPNAAYTIKIGVAQLNIQLRNEATRINPNRVTWDLLRLLMINLGVDDVTSTRIAKSIVDYRNRATTSLLGGQTVARYVDAGLPYGPSNRPFESLDELGLVIGMTPDLLARIEPYLSIYQDGTTQRDDGDMVNSPLPYDVSMALKSKYAISAFGDSSEVVKIVSMALLPGRVRFAREAIVRFYVRRISGGDQYQLLTWETPND